MEYIYIAVLLLRLVLKFRPFVLLLKDMLYSTTVTPAGGIQKEDFTKRMATRASSVQVFYLSISTDTTI